MMDPAVWIVVFNPKDKASVVHTIAQSGLGFIGSKDCFILVPKDENGAADEEVTRIVSENPRRVIRAVEKSLMALVPK